MQAPQPKPQQAAHDICGSIDDKITVLLILFPHFKRASDL